MEHTITDIFVGHLYRMSSSPIGEIAIEQARLCLLDYKEVTQVGSGIFKEHINVFLDNAKNQGGDVSIIGRTERTTLQNAAFLNAMSAHVTELDDGHRQGQIHLGASIISALLPVAEVEGLSEDDIMRGIVVGYEAAIRLAMAMNPSHKLRGYHTSGTCGTIGTSMAIAAAMRFSLPQMKTALSAAAASAAGLLELQENDSELKPYNIAQAAVGGITAAYCGLTGFKGPDDALGGRRGMLAVMTDYPKLEYLTSFLEDYYQIEKIYRKPYAACRHAHSAIEAALILKNKHDFDLRDIERVRIETYGMAITGHDHKDVRGIQSAKMSVPFSVALALVRGHAGIKDYTEDAVNDKTVRAVLNKIEMIENQEMNSWLPNKRAARVVIILTDDSYSELIEYPKGEPENPMCEDDLINRIE